MANQYDLYGLHLARLTPLVAAEAGGPDSAEPLVRAAIGGLLFMEKEWKHQAFKIWANNAQMLPGRPFPEFMERVLAAYRKVRAEESSGVRYRFSSVANGDLQCLVMESPQGELIFGRWRWEMPLEEYRPIPEGMRFELLPVASPEFGGGLPYAGAPHSVSNFTCDHAGVVTRQGLAMLGLSEVA